MSCIDVITNSNDIQLLITYHDFPDVTSFDTPKIVFPGEVHFRESTCAFQKTDEIIGRISRKSEAVTITDSWKVRSFDDVGQKPSAPVSKKNLSGPEMAKMMKKGTRVKRGQDWNIFLHGNRVCILSHYSLFNIHSTKVPSDTQCILQGI